MQMQRLALAVTPAAVATLLVALAQASSAQPEGPARKLAESAISLPEMLPGAYSESIVFVSASGNVPPELRQAMRQKSADGAQFCYLPDEVAGRRASIMEVHSGKDCRPTAGTMTGDRATARFACEDSSSKGTILFDGTVQPEIARLRVVVDVKFDKTERNMSFTTDVTWRRLGPSCAIGSGK